MFKRSAFMTCFLAGIFICESHPFAQTADTAYTLVPQTVVAGQTFNLTLKNPGFTCGTRFTNQSVSYNGETLHLSFEATEDSTVSCPASDTLFGPTFSIPPLTTGSDSVYADEVPGCAPICQIVFVPRFACMLTVKSPGTDTTWFIHPLQVAPSVPFTLQLLNYAYGNCQDSFAHDSLEMSGNSIDAFFVVESHPDSFCTPDSVPYGPSYPISGLAAGKYPVYAIQRYNCEFTQPYCPPALIYQLVDTLDVTTASGIQTQSLRPILRRSGLPEQMEVIQGYRIDGSRYSPAGVAGVPPSP